MALITNTDGSEPVHRQERSSALKPATTGAQKTEYSRFDLALSAVKDLVYDQPRHLGDVRYLGVDEHKWKHCRGQGAASFVTVIVDLTPAIDGTGPARLLDMVSGRSAAALEAWLARQDPNFRSRIQRIALDGFAGYHRAAADAIPKARTVMDPLHVVHLAA